MKKLMFFFVLLVNILNAQSFLIEKGRTAISVEAGFLQNDPSDANAFAFTVKTKNDVFFSLAISDSKVDFPEAGRRKASGVGLTLAGLRRWDSGKRHILFSILPSIGYQKINVPGYGTSKTLTVHFSFFRELLQNNQFYLTPDLNGGFLFNIGDVNQGSYPFLGLGFSVAMRLFKISILHFSYSHEKLFVNDTAVKNDLLGFGLSFGI